MRKLSLLFIGLIVVAGAISARNANASALSHLYTDGRITLLEDVDYEGFINVDESTDDDGNQTLTTDDILFGMWEVSKVGDANNLSTLHSVDPPVFTALFVLAVTGIDSGGRYSGGYTATMGPAAADYWTALGLSAPTGTDTMIVTYSDNGVDPSPETTETDPLEKMKKGLATAVGEALWEFGLTGDEDNEFWNVDMDTNALLSSGGVILLGELAYEASLNVTDAHDGVGSYELLTHSQMQGKKNFPDKLSSQLQLKGGFADTEAGYFPIRTNTDVYVKAVPEPLAVIRLVGLSAMGVVGAVWCGWRRRRRAS